MPDNVSEWNEQQLFSKLFFAISARCRDAQSNKNMAYWKNSVESKISMVMGIVNKEEKKKLWDLKIELDMAAANYFNTNPNCTFLQRKRLNDFNNTLFIYD